jgi:putative ABC transport system substrate-binding protein
MRRREALALFIGMVVCPPTLLAQQTGGNLESRYSQGKVFRVGVLTPQSAAEPPTLQRVPLERGLRDLGWLPGSNVLIDYRYAEGEPDRLERDAADLVRQNVDLLITRGAAATRAAQLATNSIPIVMAAVPDPIREGFAESLHRPGGNLTGIAFRGDPRA